ncbi:hypothetical protein CGRA01v4_01280 [Colletotrichum graminicola]|uniref:Uncharacterized protein n=1 Tax=Colletotrichum graminicola (strain M1.001 / M2 / FGSC 10212) TaxID=645133 RepID=E3QWG0_COLGM|nr:uncharacterized protein GLRG_10342 [Colletotrichum graminicola M1.001]EFQ35198.1 hypothetical protein GLRG_10342 [Colletotrichum graminicola M1.001]WDK10001.1 hypothetical protein CGRA01v4_01280 [Colletotrichum graminicola]
MSSANRKEQRVTFQATPATKGHRRQASDSGVESDFSSSPTAQEYFDLERNHSKLREEYLATRDKLKEAETMLQQANARLTAMQNTVEVLENDNKALLSEKRNLRAEVDALREDRKSRTSPPRESTKMSGALQTHPPSPKESKEPKEPKEPKESKHLRRSESKHHRSESKHRRSESKPRKTTEEKELEKRVKQDKERLRGRFDHKDDKSSSSSGSSSGRSKQSGSYIEPLGPAASRPVPPAEQPGRSRHSRAESTSYHDSIRPAVYTTTTIPDTSAFSTLPRSPAYPEYGGDYYADSASQYVQGDGSYHAYPLSPVLDAPRGRSRR